VSAEPELILVPDWDAVEQAVRAGISSERIVVAGPQASAAARSCARQGLRERRGPLPLAPHAFGKRCLVVLPTYNEKENLAAIVGDVRSYLDADVLVVDDGSPDGTGDIADRLARHDLRMRVLHRQGKQGLGTAYLAGFRFAIEHGYERVCEMDADFSHPPWDLPRLLHASLAADLVIGSRYVRGGSTSGWSLRRRLLSRAANLYARTVLGLPVRDLTAGFRCFDVDLLARLDLAQVAAHGYAFQIEMALRVARAGGRIVELPIHFVDRRAGNSKMDARIAREALILVPALRRRVSRAPSGARPRSRSASIP
jgi:dolichol-phosphate mannosyltransferase